MAMDSMLPNYRSANAFAIIDESSAAYRYTTSDGVVVDAVVPTRYNRRNRSIRTGVDSYWRGSENIAENYMYFKRLNFPEPVDTALRIERQNFNAFFIDLRRCGSG